MLFLAPRTPLGISLSSQWILGSLPPSFDLPLTFAVVLGPIVLLCAATWRLVSLRRALPG
jgi:hypothetical protein